MLRFRGETSAPKSVLFWRMSCEDGRKLQPLPIRWSTIDAQFAMEE